MNVRPRKTITPEQWDAAADAYELGSKSGRQIAEELGVSSQTVSRHMRLRGSKKGNRAFETVVNLDAFLDRKARRAVYMRRMLKTTAAERRAATMAVIDLLMRTLVEAERQGDLMRVQPLLDQVGGALGMKTSRRR